MNTQPATPWTAFRQSPPTSFPVLVKFRNDQYSVWYADLSDMFDEGEPVYWQPFIPPAPPPREIDAFAQWIDSKPELGMSGHRTCWNAGEAHGRSEERARFAEGVEKLIGRIQNHGNYYYGQFYADLRALAKGAA